MIRRMVNKPCTLLRDERGLAFLEFCLILPFVLFTGYGGLETANYVLTYMKISQIAMTVADNAGRVRQALDETDVNQLMVGARLMGSGLKLGANGRIILSDLEMRTSNTNTTATTITTDNPNGYRQWIRWQRCTGALQVPAVQALAVTGNAIASSGSSYGVPLDVNAGPVTNLNSSAKDDGAVETKSTLLGMGPSGSMITSSAGTAVMFVEVWYTYQPLIPGTYLLGKLNLLGSLTMHTTEAFNIRQRTDFSIYNSQSLSGSNRADCTLFSATAPAGGS